MQYPSGMIMHPYRSSGLLPDRRNGFGDGLAVGVDEIVGTAVGLNLGVFVAMSEPVDRIEGVGIGVDLGVSVGANERVDGATGIVVGVEIGVADAASTGDKLTTTGTLLGTSGVCSVLAVQPSSTIKNTKPIKSCISG